MGAAIERELSEITKVSKRKTEDMQTFLGRLAEKCGDLPNDSWDKLSHDAQVWANAAVEAVDKNKTIPAIGNEAAADTDDDKDEATTMATNGKAPAKSKGKAKAAAPAKSKGKAKPAAAKPAAAKKPSTTPKEISPTMALRQIAVKDPQIAVDALIDKLKKGGHKVSLTTAASILADVRATLKALKATSLYTSPTL